MGWLKKVWRYMFKDPPPVVPGGFEKEKAEEHRLQRTYDFARESLALVKAELACPNCSGPLEESVAKPGIYRCRACNQAIIKSHVWDDPNFQAELTHYNKGTVPFERVDGINAHPLAEEYDIDEVMDGFAATPERLNTDLGKLPAGPHGGKIIASGKLTSEDVFKARDKRLEDRYDPDEVMTKIYDAHLDREIARSDRRLANEIDAARSFGQAYIEEKHGIPFSQWVRERKEKREESEDENSE